MPATIALMNAYFEGAERQRALSYWSIGSWGGSGVCSFAGGLIATYLGWRWIFIFSIAVALAAMWLIREVPESRAKEQGKFKFDFTGLAIFAVTMLALNLLITRGQDFGFSLFTLGLAAIALVGAWLFVRVERGKPHAMMDFSLFKNKPYVGSTISNLLLNAVAGTLVVANTYVQVGRGFTSFQSGLLSIGYLVTVLAMIRVGEKILQRMGAKAPMIWGAAITTVGVGLMGLTFLPGLPYHRRRLHRVRPVRPRPRHLCDAVHRHGRDEFPAGQGRRGVGPVQNGQFSGRVIRRGHIRRRLRGAFRDGADQHGRRRRDHHQRHLRRSGPRLHRGAGAGDGGQGREGPSDAGADVLQERERESPVPPPACDGLGPPAGQA